MHIANGPSQRRVTSRVLPSASAVKVYRYWTRNPNKGTSEPLQSDADGRFPSVATDHFRRSLPKERLKPITNRITPRTFL